MVLLVILVLAALAFGIGAVIEGLLWLILITLVLVAVAIWWGWRTLSGAARSRRV